MLCSIVLKLWIYFLIYIYGGLCLSAEEGGIHDVIIIGGGVAGIRAAANLEQHGITDIKIIERADRLGGIIRSGNFNGYTVELGPGRVWDNDPEITNLTNQFINTIPYPPMKYVFYDDFGNDVTLDYFKALERHDTASELVNNYAKKIRSNDYPDISVINAYRWMGFYDTSPIERMVNFRKNSIRDDPELESLKYKISQVQPLRLARQDGDGYAKLVIEYGRQSITDLETKLELETTVTKITRRKHNVSVYTEDDHFVAKHIIVAYSFGELQHQSMIFEPPLPDWKLHAIHGYAVEKYMHIYLRFPEEQPWFIPTDIYRMGHVGERRNHYMFWQNFEKRQDGSRIVGCYVKNNQAAQIRRMTDEEITKEAVEVLRKMFGDAVPDPEEILVPRGNDDPLLYGVYSYWPTGFTMAQHEALKAAVGQVHFAGDYYMGNTDYALPADWAAGKKVAENVHSCMDEPTAEPEVCGSFQPSYMERGCTYDSASNYDPKAKENDGSCRLVGMAPGSAGHVEVSLTVMLVAICCIIVSLIDSVLAQQRTVF